MLKNTISFAVAMLLVALSLVVAAPFDDVTLLEQNNNVRTRRAVVFGTQALAMLIFGLTAATFQATTSATSIWQIMLPNAVENATITTIRREDGAPTSP